MVWQHLPRQRQWAPADYAGAAVPLTDLTKVKESVFLTAKATAVCWLFIGSWTFASVFIWADMMIEHWCWH